VQCRSAANLAAVKANDFACKFRFFAKFYVLIPNKKRGG
jgi:hypothetical protein